MYLLFPPSYLVLRICLTLSVSSYLSSWIFFLLPFFSFLLALKLYILFLDFEGLPRNFNKHTLLIKIWVIYCLFFFFNNIET